MRTRGQVYSRPDEVKVGTTQLAPPARQVLLHRDGFLKPGAKSGVKYESVIN